jgi:DNA-directed RNA polymerase specialized sigma24 family protein
MARGITPWRLTPAAFERLLGVLDNDRERAAIAYEQFRTRIAGLLRWWGASNPDDLADQTLDRVARKLEEGATVPPGSVGAYVRGVARMVFYESARDGRARRNAVAPPAEDRTDVEARHACLDRCLSDLDGGERSLVLRYYEHGRKEEMRRGLARELGVSLTALRIRMHRLRQRLELCVTGCMEPQ